VECGEKRSRVMPSVSRPRNSYSPGVRVSIACIGQGPEHSRGLIPTPFTVQVPCLGILQVKLIKSVEKVRGYNIHHERNHQGKGNMLLFPAVSQGSERRGPIQCRERLGGLLKYDACEAACVFWPYGGASPFRPLPRRLMRSFGLFLRFTEKASRSFLVTHDVAVSILVCMV